MDDRQIADFSPRSKVVCVLLNTENMPIGSRKKYLLLTETQRLMTESKLLLSEYQSWYHMTVEMWEEMQQSERVRTSVTLVLGDEPLSNIDFAYVPIASLGM